jgi:cytochrome P450
VPFSAGPAGCPGRNLVLFVTSTLLASLLDKADFTLTSGQRIRPDEPLPATLNNFGLEFAVK